MRVLYFGTVCDLNSYEQLLKNCKKRPTVATVVFESALLDGFQKNGADLEIHSFPLVPTFPGSLHLCFGGHSEDLPCGYRSRWLFTVNIPILKQWSRRMDARRVIRRWGKTCSPDDVILTYSIPPFLVKDILRYGKKYSVKTAAIVPDLPKDMYINEKAGTIVSVLKKLYLKPAKKFQGNYDGYVYLTEQMRNEVAAQKPYIVMEGIANQKEEPLQNPEKSSPRAIMYAGGLHEKYGIINLLDAFERLDTDAELWLFGDGTAVADIKSRAKGNRRIRYFGRLPREEIVEYERKATLLVNPRSVREAFTKYSFPSKTIEYMYSATPLLTTKLAGIPREYFDYVFTADDNDTELLAEAMQKALSLPDEVLTEMGKRARWFIREQKNSTTQSRRILDFLSELTGN